MHIRHRREKFMSKQLSIKTTACSNYQRLLEECQGALEIWNKRRAETSQARANKMDEGDELLRLQANFARAYAVLEHHSHDCELCELISHIEECDSENCWDTLSDNPRYV
jgi:hypothetical protein